MKEVSILDKNMTGNSALWEELGLDDIDFSNLDAMLDEIAGEPMYGIWGMIPLFLGVALSVGIIEFLIKTIG